MPLLMSIVTLSIVLSFTVFCFVSNVEGRGTFIRSHKMTLGELEKLAKKEKDTEQKLSATQRRRNKLTHSYYHDDYHDDHHDDHHGRHRHGDYHDDHYGRHRHGDYHDDHYGRHGRHRHGDHRRKDDREPYTPSPLDVDKYGTTSYSQMTNPLPKWGVYLNPVGSDVYDNSMWHNIVNSHKDN